jgi:cysteine synthase A
MSRDEARATESLAALFAKVDVNANGKLEYSELTRVFGEFADQFLEFCDQDKDKEITVEEWTAAILKDTADLSEEDFQAQWVTRMTESLAAAAPAALTSDAVLALLPQILEAVPQDWKGTTFSNKDLIGRVQFGERLHALFEQKAASKESISSEDLTALGNAEDYLRVATNLATVLEYILAMRTCRPGMEVARVFSFASQMMPILAVALTAGKPVHVYCEDSALPFTAEQLEELAAVQAHVQCYQGSPAEGAHEGEIVLAFEAAYKQCAGVHGVVADGILYVEDVEAISPDAVLVIRKRMSITATTPMVLAALYRLAGVDIPADLATEIQVDSDSDSDRASLFAHLQELSGTTANPDTNPVIFTAGLPTIASLWLTLIARGGADVLMCSTAYGGCSELTDLLCARSQQLTRTNFDIQGDINIEGSIKEGMDHLSTNGAHPTTVLFVEIPTNPDQKIPDVAQLAQMLTQYQQDTGKQMVLLVDTTFCPGSKIMLKVQEVAPELPVVVFTSLSKSVSRGVTTAGVLVANHTELSQQILNKVGLTGQMLDTTAKPDQLTRLVKNHDGVEQRCQNAYDNAVAAAAALRAGIHEETGQEMEVAYVSPEHAEAGFKSATFSFNLPSLEGFTSGQNEALAQQFVDLLTDNALFKPCVSFGQDNGLVYCTVPATSTQGAIKEEDKAKQAKGGVQLVRLSFPPAIDMAGVQERLVQSVHAIYVQ